MPAAANNLPLGKPQFPVDFNAVRVALVDQVQQAVGATCIMFEPETPNAPRPPKPYFAMKFLSPAVKKGDDSRSYNGTTNVVNIGGQRKMVVDFDCYGRSHEEAYSYMAAWQSALETETVQWNLRAAGIAVWLNGSVLDLSALLNTGFEGRCHMQVDFGVAANVTENLGTIDKATVTGTVTSDQNDEDTLTITEP